MTDFTGTYVLDAAHSEIGFVTRHAAVTKVRGKFDEFDASVTIDGAAPANNKAVATIKANSLNTGNADRDAHVRGDDFFSVEQFPEIHFEAEGFDFQGQEEFEVEGNITIKGVTKPVRLNVEFLGVAEDPYGQTRLGFAASTKINRKDFGIDFNAPLKTGGLLLSEEIKIEIDGSAVKQG
ncbi:YceI family protein [Corynebacterium sp. 153RC1]|uniref:YceI family protein n=1 Tax=unclassified Corynebacterium TaxID=2624378 RepID=UPI00211C80F4|nr:MULTISPECIES: YceI family protein [unclassified Corynebacterium]MCQ9352009.1 YceI family protein [Corynebacterium sp. 209RC1]MCQ9353758.1 YceI family protein [Corynebacterium sp. 1222RC1]MCQ9356258.1 YceI family protein [Corynebacterium sp. 122RC1]MCQ9358360.1 YceI family protein [Corynebacterium sp. 142RC1]MCQ9360905.1 YceI family protein [Corynebacterium sp. 153RC1]